MAELQLELAEAIADLHPVHRTQFEEVRVAPRLVSVTAHPGEFVYVVAEYQGKILYFSDVEEGWELEIPNASGGIDERGCNQFKLTHILYQVFGDPER